MALGYRYWTGIGVREDCAKAVEWYERAARQGSRFALLLVVSLLMVIAVSHEHFQGRPTRREDDTTYLHQTF